MSGKGPPSRSKRSEKDTYSADSKHDGSKGKHESKHADSRERSSNLSDGRSPSHGRSDRNHNTKEGKPYPKSKDRGSGQDGRKREGEKGEGRKALSNSKHGRDGDSISNHHPHGHGHVQDRGSLSSGRDMGSSDVNNKKQSESKMFSDESRLSKLVRRVTREDDRDRRLTAIRQLKEFITLPENTKSVTKISENLLGTLHEIFYEKTYKEVKQEAARCIGAVGTVLEGDNERYLQWLFVKLTSAHTDEAKILLLSALLQTLKQDEEKQKLSESMSMIVSNCQSVLENADQPELLTAVIDVILHIVQIQPYVFNNHFRDTVDILVGWHIDSTQKESLTRYTSEALIKFHQFWVADLTFSITLLGQFLEDMEAYAEDLSLGLSGQAPMDDDMPSPDECVSKIANLLRVFTTVMKSLGEYFTPAHGPPVTIAYIVDTLERVIKCVENSNRTMYCERVTTAANYCIEVLVLNLKSDTMSAMEVLQSFIMDQFMLERQLSQQCLVSLLVVTQIIIEQIGIQLPMSFMRELLKSGSLAYKLRFAMNGEVLGALMAVYTTVMGLKSVALLEETYKHLLGDLEIAYGALLKSCEADYECCLVTNNPYPDVSYNTQQAEVAIVFDVCALAEVGNTKNNLIGMWALSPSIFELLTSHLITAQSQLRGRHPSTQYALLQTLYSHSTRHGHFISSSTLITRNTVREGSVLANVSSATAGHFTIVLRLIADHLKNSCTPDDIRVLLMRWVSEISDALVNSQHICVSHEFLAVLDTLIELGYVQESTTALSVCACLKAVLNNMAQCPSMSLKRCVDLCLFRLTDTSIKVRNGYLTLLKVIPINVTTRLCTTLVSKPRLEKSSAHCRTKRNITSVWAARRSHMSKVAPGTFHSHNFRTVMAYILHNLPPSKLSGNCWLERMFFSSQRLDKDREGRDDFVPLSHVVEQNEGQLWFWAAWEAAQFCILAKLRTPLGKPHDTFTTIEGAIKRYASEVRNKDIDDNTRPVEESKDAGVPCFVAQLRVSLLLQFMEHLEKLLYNAYEGCATAMVAPPKVVRTFFRNNRGTCQEWLMRVRHPLTLVALNSQQPALAIRQASERLREMCEAGQTSSVEFEHMLMYMVNALVEMRCPEAVMGLYTWCKDILNKRLTWIKAMAELALGRYETGAMELKSALRQHITPDPSLEDVREKEGSQSPAAQISPCHSPKQSFITDGMQKLSILSKQGTKQDGLSSNHAGSDSHAPDPSLGNFMVDQVCSSYLALRSYKEALEWQETIQQYRAEHSGSPLQKAFYTHADINFIKALSKFDERDFEGVREALDLVPGASLDDFTTDISSLAAEGVWTRPVVLDTVQKQLVRAATFIHTENYWKEDSGSIIRCIEGVEKLCEGVLRLGAGEWPPVVCPDVMAHFRMCSVLRQAVGKERDPKEILAWSDDLGTTNHEHDIGTMESLLACLNLHLYGESSDGDKNTGGSRNILSHLTLTTARLARKTHNFQLAEKLLISEAENSMRTEPENGKIESVLGMLTGLHAANGTKDQIQILKMEREGAKLLHARGQHREAADMLTSTILAHVNASDSPSSQTKAKYLEVGELVSRSVVGLVQWLQMDYKNLGALASQLKMMEHGDDSNASRAARNVQALIDIEKTAHKQDDCEFEQGENEIVEGSLMSDSDLVVGQLLSLSTHQSPCLAKAWFSLAGWCYKWGRKAVDSASNGCVDLTTEEKAQVLNLLPKGTSNEETESVLTILSQVHAGVTGDEDISDQDQSLYDDGAETTRRQLLSSCLSLQIASDETLDRLLEVWRRVVRRVYHYYQMAARAYFTFLKLNSEVSEDLGNMDGNITATLRLLRLLVKHAWELRGVLEDGLAHTPTAPWKGIIPQLFSRLNHPEAYVRQSVSELLCRVAQDAPHLIVYPAVVGCNSHTDIKDTREGLLSKYLDHTDIEIEEGEASQVDDDDDPTTPDEDPSTADPNTAMLQNCFTAIVDTLAHHNPRMISEVQLLVSELRRITLLWDELWLGTLNQHHHDVMRRLMQLDSEVKKVNTNNNLSKEEKSSLIHEKHITILKPTVFTMERLVALTSAPAETPHEQWFQDTYGQVIKDALDKLNNPSNPALPHTSWAPFKQLHRSLTDRAQKRSSLVLNMDQISKKLGALRNTVIAMPGINASGHVVTIEAINQGVQILPTKTKPKKLVFIGSDGKKYPYLFKGLEDLHLDERIMQFLSIVNNMFAKANKGEVSLYHARHYSVTPLGARSGLIQWVDGATPLFSLYKRWQQREAVAQQLKLQQQPGPSQSSTTTTPSAPSIPRPSDVFYSKLTPALKEKGVINLESRKEWPLSVMRQVLQELMNETPQDLLAKELWCSSTSAAEWWRVTQTYGRSTAVMSMIGYIIGLGDRHLDNVLVDLITGEVVHIDYNVCFEKGKGLRVPEKVPFRMTPNIETALGVTGVEGMFRISCEHVIKTMRKGRETLLTLLEAFVYDPLVDWTTSNEGGYTGAFYGGGQTTVCAVDGQQTKKDMERDITLSMFSIRMAEMKAAWLTNREEMLSCLPHLQEALDAFFKIQKEQMEGEKSLEQFTEQLMYIEEALKDPHHALYSLPQRFEDFAMVRATRQDAELAVQDKLNECDHWHNTHKYGFNVVQGSRLQKLCSEVSVPLSATLPSFSAVFDFLRGAGQAHLVSQCEAIESELHAVLHQRRSVLHSCLDVLHTYATVVSQFPQTYVAESRTCRWQQWLQGLICDFTLQKCKDIVAEFQDYYGLTATPHPATPAVLTMESKLQTMINEGNSRLMKVVERRSLDPTETSRLALHAQESSTAVHQYMHENGIAGVMCMTSVVASALCSLSKRYLVMEGAAAAAADRLMDLTSREGDWFLDELSSMSGNVSHLLHLITDNAMNPLLSPDMSQRASAVMNSIHIIYLALQDLYINFRSIIVPEAAKTLSRGDATVAASLDALYHLIEEPQRPLETLMTQLETQLRNSAIGTEVDPEPLNVAKRLRQRFSELLQGEQVNDEAMNMTPGQMLLMGFNGLFTRLDAEFSAMMEAISCLDVPDTWRKVDIVREARVLQTVSPTDQNMNLLSHLFFVKQLRAMTDFFHLSRTSVTSLHSLSGGALYDDEQLSRPIKHFVAEYVRKHVMGLPSQTLGHILCVLISSLHVDVTAEIELHDVGAESKVSIEALCKKVVDTNLKNGAFEHRHLTHASTLLGAVDVAWRKSDLARRLDGNISLLKGSVQRSQMALSRYHWLHEDIFTKAGHVPAQVYMANRQTIMSELRKDMQTLMSHEGVVNAIQDRHSGLEGSITQRLKWAAGANPSLTQVLQQFEEALNARNILIQNENVLANEVMSVCNSILHFESLRTRTSEAITADTGFLQLINRCEESCMLLESCATTVTDTEEELYKLKPLTLGEKVTPQWISSIQQQVAMATADLQIKSGKLSGAAESVKDGVKQQVSAIRTVLSMHHKLMSDIRSILKSMAKQEEYDYGPESVPGGIREYVSTYKSFSENFTSMLKLVVRDDLSPLNSKEINDMMASLNEQIVLIYDDLVNFAPPLILRAGEENQEQNSFATALKKPSDTFGPGSPKKLPLVQRAERIGTPPATATASPTSSSTKIGTPTIRRPDKVARDPRTGKAVQERNSYAVGVWRRVKLKLDGRDPDQNKRFSVADQVDYVIREATSLDNLAVLYEGWTPWV